MTLQVLIVGAGPVGLTLAAELSRYGIAVRIVDKAPRRTDKSKALVLWSRTLELLQRSDSASAFITAGHRVEAANIVAGGKTIARIDFAGVDSPYAFALMLPQSDTERMLEEHLAGFDVTVERETELLGFSDTGAGIDARLRHADRTEQAVQSDWLVGCDGAHSTVRHALNLTFGGDTLKSDWILADVHIDGVLTPVSEMATYWHEDGVLVVFPISPGRYRIIADIGKSQGSMPADPTLEQIQAIVDRRGPGAMVVSKPIWLSAFRINERKVEQYRAGRVFVAGDAAHVHSPAGGQGMNTGMQDAFNLAWKLALVCRGDAAEKNLLDSYSVERSAVGAQVLAAAGRLTAVAVMKNHAAQALRNLVGGFALGLAPVRRAMARSMSEVSVGYAHSPLNGAHTFGLEGPAPGERMPFVSGEVPVGAGDAPRFALCAASGEAANELIVRYRNLLESSPRPPLRAGGAWLIRPDGYVACAVSDHDLQPIATYLRTLETRSG
jgi:2-polyprenyl-6-methoxyphenol hydroxylase-like FAD-dependent oxidoreductase